jgi:excinuclease UvrABC nuclease subunit
MQRFGTVKAIGQASLEELLSVPGIDRTAALSIKEHLR